MRNKPLRAALAAVAILSALSPLLLAQLPGSSPRGSVRIPLLSPCRIGLTGRVVVVSDATSTSDCTVGGEPDATARSVECICDRDGAGGFAWRPAGAEGAGGPPSGAAGGDLAGTYPNPTIGADKVALGTDTTGPYAASSTEAGAATTAVAFVTNGTNCSAGSFPLGVSAGGDAETCTALPTTISGTANQITASGSTGAITLSIPTSPTLPGTTTGTFSGPLTGAVTGNASTATALAANGANCASGEAAQGVSASGAAEGCFTPGGGGGLTNPLAAGTVSANALQVVQAGTGLWQPASNVLGVAANGVEAMRFNTVTAGVNFFAVTPQATGGGSANGPTIMSTGADGSVDFNFDTKGTGARYQWKIDGVTKMDYTDLGGGNFALRNLSGQIKTGAGVLDNNYVAWNADSSVGRLAAGVVGMGTGSNNSSGYYQWAGECHVGADATNATTTFASTGCSMPVTSGRKYKFECTLYLADSVAAEGAKIDFGGGTATATDFRAQVKAFDSALNFTTQVTSLTAPAGASTFTGDGSIEVSGSFEPSSSGTFIPRYAQNSHAIGTLTLYRGSSCLAWDMP